jgi:hypothetical protein
VRSVKNVSDTAPTLRCTDSSVPRYPFTIRSKARSEKWPEIDQMSRDRESAESGMDITIKQRSQIHCNLEAILIGRAAPAAKVTPLLKEDDTMNDRFRS